MLRGLIFLLFFSLTALGTVFSPVPIKQQIKESSGFVKGQVISKNVEDHPELGKVTKVFLRADAWSGSRVRNNHIEVLYPGGGDGVDMVTVHGAPKFAVGEKVVVFFNEHEQQNWVSNLALGKFSIKKLGRLEFMVNDVFPKVPNVGQMPLKNFYRVAAEITKTPLNKRFKSKYERSAIKSSKISASKKVGRLPASVPAPVKKPSPVWLVLLLGIAGLFVRALKGRKKS